MWAGAEGLVDPAIYHRLQVVAPLKKGRTKAREPRPIKPVPRSHIRRIRPCLCRQVRALDDLQLLSAARGGELTNMRPVDLDTTGPVWTYAPESHKSEHHDKQRVIYLGPWAQQIIRLFMTPDHPITAPLLSPRHAEAERHAKAGTHRRPNQNPNVKKISCTLGHHNTTVVEFKNLHGYETRLFAFLAEIYISSWLKTNSNYLEWSMLNNDISQGIT